MSTKRARLDADKTAKPLTEIVGVFPTEKKSFYSNAEALIARPTGYNPTMHYGIKDRAGYIICKAPGEPFDFTTRELAEKTMHAANWHLDGAEIIERDAPIRMAHSTPDPRCASLCEECGLVAEEVAETKAKLDTLREAVLDFLIEHQATLAPDVRARLRKAVGRIG